MTYARLTSIVRRGGAVGAALSSLLSLPSFLRLLSSIFWIPPVLKAKDAGMTAAALAGGLARRMMGAAALVLAGGARGSGRAAGWLFWIPPVLKARDAGMTVAALALLGVGALSALPLAPAQAQQAQPLPEISVSAVRKQVIEGETIEFTLAADPALAAPVTLRYRVEQPQGADVLVGDAGRALISEGRRELALPAGFGSGVLSVRTAQDQVPEGNASVTLTILYGIGYAAAPGARNARTLVLDDDSRPLIIVRNATETVEGGQSVFPVALYDPDANQASVALSLTTTTPPLPAVGQPLYARLALSHARV